MIDERSDWKGYRLVRSCVASLSSRSLWCRRRHEHRERQTQEVKDVMRLRRCIKLFKRQIYEARWSDNCLPCTVHGHFAHSFSLPLFACLASENYVRGSPPMMNRFVRRPSISLTSLTKVSSRHHCCICEQCAYSSGGALQPSPCDQNAGRTLVCARSSVCKA